MGERGELRPPGFGPDQLFSSHVQPVLRERLAGLTGQSVTQQTWLVGLGPVT